MKEKIVSNIITWRTDDDEPGDMFRLKIRMNEMVREVLVCACDEYAAITEVYVQMQDSIETIDEISWYDFEEERWENIEYRLGVLAENVLKKANEDNKDLVSYFLRCMEKKKEMNEQELGDLEISHNSSQGKSLCNYEWKAEGANFRIEDIKKNYSGIWGSYIFIESTDAGFELIQLYLQCQKLTDPEEFLYWTFKMCAWSSYICYYPYTLYKALLNDRFEKYYDSFAEYRGCFLRERD